MKLLFRVDRFHIMKLGFGVVARYSSVGSLAKNLENLEICDTITSTIWSSSLP